jgi:putative Mg2+ transporter-C (MgtC) family protein
MDEEHFFPDWVVLLFEQEYIDYPVIILRLTFAIFLSGIIGWEREVRSQAAGFRTHILICMGSTLLMIISIYIPQTFIDFQNGDPGRIAAQVVSGIGFLGAGAIFRLGGTIKGLTTAATIWTVAAIGLAIGAGMYLASMICTFFILFVLVTLNKVGKKYFPVVVLKILHIQFSTTKIPTDHVFSILEKYHIKTQSLNILQSLDKKQTKMKLFIQISKEVELKKLYKDLNNLENVTKITLSQDF